MLGQSLSHEEWLASLTVLPTLEEMEELSDVDCELVAEVMEKSKHVVSFSVTPAMKKPQLSHLVSKIVNSKRAQNLAHL